MNWLTLQDYAKNISINYILYIKNTLTVNKLKTNGKRIKFHPDRTKTLTTNAIRNW